MSEWKKTLCNLCAMTCGLEMEIEDNRIINVRPDPDSPSSECYCCRKGRSAKYFVENSERILYPKKRVGDHYERISWEQAYAEITEKANAIRNAHGPRSVALIGGGGGATGAAAATAQPFLKAMGSQYFFNPIGVEFMGIFWSCGRIFGDQFHPLEPDDKNCEVIIFWGEQFVCVPSASQRQADDPGVFPGSGENGDRGGSAAFGDGPYGGPAYHAETGGGYPVSARAHRADHRKGLAGSGFPLPLYQRLDAGERLVRGFRHRRSAAGLRCFT